MSINTNATIVAARRLLEMADRVLGEGSTPSGRYAYVSLILSQWTEEIDPSLRANLRLSCYEQLFLSEHERRADKKWGNS